MYEKQTKDMIKEMYQRIRELEAPVKDRVCLACESGWKRESLSLEDIEKISCKGTMQDGCRRDDSWRHFKPNKNHE